MTFCRFQDIMHFPKNKLCVCFKWKTGDPRLRLTRNDGQTITEVCCESQVKYYSIHFLFFEAFEGFIIFSTVKADRVNMLSILNVVVLLTPI